MTDSSKRQETAPGHLGYLLTAYLFQNLSAAGIKEVETHLAGCERCREELEKLRQTLGLVEKSFAAESREYVFEERRLKRVLQFAQRRPAYSPLRVWSKFALASVAALLMCCILLFATMSRSENAPQASNRVAADSLRSMHPANLGVYDADVSEEDARVSTQSETVTIGGVSEKKKKSTETTLTKLPKPPGGPNEMRDGEEIEKKLKSVTGKQQQAVVVENAEGKDYDAPIAQTVPLQLSDDESPKDASKVDPTPKAGHVFTVQPKSGPPAAEEKYWSGVHDGAGNYFGTTDQNKTAVARELDERRDLKAPVAQNKEKPAYGLIDTWNNASKKPAYKQPPLVDSNEEQDNSSFRVRRGELKFNMDIHENTTGVVQIDPAREATSFPNVADNQAMSKSIFQTLDQVSPEFDAANGPGRGDKSSVSGVKTGAGVDVRLPSLKKDPPKATPMPGFTNGPRSTVGGTLDSRESSDIVVPPDILAKAELGDHLETIDPDRPDTHSAYGNPDAHIFHSVEGKTESAGGGGMNGKDFDDLLGVGGAAHAGGNFAAGDGTGIGRGNGSFGSRSGSGGKLLVKKKEEPKPAPKILDEDSEQTTPSSKDVAIASKDNTVRSQEALLAQERSDSATLAKIYGKSPSKNIGGDGLDVGGSETPASGPRIDSTTTPAQVANGDIANAHLEAGKRLFDSFQYEEARKEFELAAQRDRANDDASKFLTRTNDILSVRRDRIKSSVAQLYGEHKVAVQEKLVELDNRVDWAKRYMNEAQNDPKLSLPERVIKYQQAQLTFERARELVKYMPVEINVEEQNKEVNRLLQESVKALAAAEARLAETHRSKEPASGPRVDLGTQSGNIVDPFRPETLLRGYRYFHAQNPELTFRDFAQRPSPVPAAKLTDDGLDEDEYIERFGTRPFVDCARDHLSTFGLDVDTASYAFARSRLRQGQLPDPEAVRVEEFLNYFKQPYSVAGEDAFGVFAEGAPSPFGCGGVEILKIGIKSRDPKADERKPAMLTFCVDTSGSMTRDDRLELVRASLSELVRTLNPEDAVSIVGFGEQAELILPRTQAKQKQRILDAIEGMSSRGSTNVEAGLNMAYRMADESYSADAVNRIILCSDGVANVGAKGPDEMLKLVKVFSGRGIELSTVGFGMGKYNDKMMMRLADNGNGSCHFVDNLDEAKKVFTEQLPSHLSVLARDAKAQVDFNPDVIDRYRLLGYEKRKIADKDFRNDAIDSGDVGHSTLVTVMYEITRKPAAHGSLGKVYLRWKDAGYRHLPVVERNYPLNEGMMATEIQKASPQLRFLACVARFAELLRESPWVRDSSYAAVLEELKRLPTECQQQPAFREVTELVQIAQKLSVEKWSREVP